MFKIMTEDEAVMLIKDGDCIGINCFLTLANPDILHKALADRYEKTKSPSNLKLYCTAGFGGWDENTFAEPYVAAGAVKEVVAGHFNSMPAVMRMARENKIEAYNLPLGVMSHSLRAAAGRRGGFLSKVGLGIFVDPRLDGPGINDISKQELVKVVTLEGEEYLYYKTPKIDIAFIKGTTVDPNGNISFEREYLTIDALAMAQAAKNNGGKVIVQVDQVSHIFARPRNIIIPGILVDAVVVGEGQEMEHHRVYNPTLSGDIHVPPTHMDYWMGKLDPAGKRKKGIDEYSAEIIGERAAKELKQGDIVNIGIGLPEMVGKYASQMGVLKDITLTVEAGGIGGVPAPGACFGATIGPDMICDMANQFDFYDGGGLSICFMGAIEADCHGNVNAHRMGERFAGIGGFANITAAAKTVVFCMNFTTKGLNVVKENGKISIKQEGSIRKFKKEIRSISFSGKNAIARGQRVLYITERCVFTLTKDGLSLLEVYDGIDKKSCIIDLLDFELAE